MQDTEKMAQVLAEHNKLIGSLVEQLEPVASAIATDEGKALDRVVAASDRLLLAAAQQQEDLDASLNELPDTVASLRKTLARLDRTAEETAPTLRRLRPLTDDLPQIAAELETMADALDPALASSEPVLKRARKLLKAAAPTATSLRRAGPGLAKTTNSAVPLVDELNRNRENVFNYIRYWALATNGRDGLSHYFRVNATVNPDTITGLLPVSSGEPARRSAKAPTSGGVPPAVPKDVTDEIDGLLGGQRLLLPPLSSRSSKSSSPRLSSPSPTGLSSEQESDLFGFLLGGG